MTIIELARRLHVTPQAIYRWFRLGWPVPREGRGGAADLPSYPPPPRERVVRTARALAEYRAARRVPVGATGATESDGRERGGANDGR